MESEWKRQIAGIEQRARAVNLALNQLCVAAGVRQNNLTRWKQGFSPSLRIFLRDLGKLESKLTSIEYEMAMRLIARINPVAAPRIAELLRAPEVGDPTYFSSEAKPLPEKADGLGSRADRGTDGCRAA